MFHVQMRFTKVIGLLFFFLILFEGKANDATDSLLLLLQKNIPDSMRTNVLLELSQSFYNIDLKKSLTYAEEAHNLANENNFDKGVQHSLSILSRIQRRMGNFSVAIEYNIKELYIARKRHDTEGIIDSYTTMGNIYSSLENYDDAQKNLSKAYSLAQSTNHESLVNIMNFIGRNYGKMHQNDSAEYWILRALEQEKKFPQKGYSLSYIYNNLAEIYYNKKQYNKTLKYYILSKNLPENKKSPFGKTFTLNGLARTYKDLNKYDEAIKAAEESIAISKKFSYRDKTKESYGILYEIYQKSKDFEKALINYKQFNLYQDSIFSEDNLQYVENLKIQYETERVTAENELLKKDAELKDAYLAQQKNLTIVGAIALLSLIGAMLFLFYGYRQKKKTNQFLAEYNKNLETQVEQRTKELVKTNLELIRQNNQLEQYGYITAHNLRSPVARILGLTNILNSDNFDPAVDKHLLDKLQLTANELDTIIYDINAILDVKNGIENSYEIVDFHERLEKIRSILKDSITNTQTTIEADFSAVKSCFSIPAYIESIFFNLISNAIKYRSPKRNPEIKIKSRIKEGTLELMFSDNGIGMDLNKMKDKIFSLYQRFHDHVEGKGMGLFLVKTQVEALNGNINIESTVDEGTTFSITIPLVITTA